MTRVADYQTIQLLGKGGNGQVWLATPPPRLGLAEQEVAVKVFDRPASQRELAAIADELKLIASVQTPHVIQLFDVGLAGGRLYVAMEYVANGSLEDPHRPLDPGERARAVAAAARGAHALHEVGVVHRDVRPANILLGEDAVKLTDPGLAHLLAPGQTVTGVAATATVEFMEPGVVRGERASRASDIWSLGVTLHWALSGNSVYGALPEGNTVTILKHVVGTPPRFSADIRAERLEIIRRCLAPDRAERYPTAMEVADAIENTEHLVGAQ